MNKITISQIISIFLLAAFAFGSFLLGMYIKDQGQDIINFCNSHYKNKTFQDSMTREADYYHISLCDWKAIKNSNDYENCLIANATESQLKFIHNCHWMGPDYRILVGTVLFGVIVPLIMIIFGILTVLDSSKAEEVTHE